MIPDPPPIATAIETTAAKIPPKSVTTICIPANNKIKTTGRNICIQVGSL